MLLAALLLIWPLTETHTAPESSCLLVRQRQRVYLAMTVEVSRLSGAATVTLPGPEVTVGTPPKITAEQQAKLDACRAEQDAKMAENKPGERYAGLFSGLDCNIEAGVPLPRTKRSPGRVVTLARFDSISNDVPCVCKWDHCVVR